MPAFCQHVANFERKKSTKNASTLSPQPSGPLKAGEAGGGGAALAAVLRVGRPRRGAGARPRGARPAGPRFGAGLLGFSPDWLQDFIGGRIILQNVAPALQSFAVVRVARSF